MLQDCVFPVAWFSMWMKCPLCSIRKIQYPGLHFKSHFPGCLFLKYTWSPTWKAGLSLARVLWVAVNLFSSRVFLAIASANLCVSRCSLPKSGSPRDQDHVFPVAWFSMWMKCPLHSIWTIQYLGLHFKSNFPGCFFLKYTQSPTWKAGLSLARVLWVAVNLFSSRVFLAIASANLCVSRCSLPKSGSPRETLHGF